MKPFLHPASRPLRGILRCGVCKQPLTAGMTRGHGGR